MPNTESDRRPAVGGGRFAVGFLSDRGLNPDRPVNEDAFFAPDEVEPGLISERGRLFAVADGMGGAAAGEVASRLGIDVFKEHYYHGPWAGSPGRMLTQAAGTANRAVLTAADAPERKGMGATLTALAVHAGRVLVLNLGDSRCYRVRDGQIEQLTEDHTVVTRLVRKRLMTPEQARVSPQRNVLTRVLGKENVEPELFEHPARAGDIFVLATDGVHGVLTDEEILGVVQELPPGRAAGRIVELVKDKGAPDNATIIIVKSEERGVKSEDKDRTVFEPSSAHHSLLISHHSPERTAVRGRRRRRAGCLFLPLGLLVLAAVVVLGLRAYLGHWPGQAPRTPVPADTTRAPDTLPVSDSATKSKE